MTPRFVLSIIVGVTLATSPARATVIATMQQVGPDIVVSGDGTVNLADLTFAGNASADVGMTPSNPSIGFGAQPLIALLIDFYTPITPPTTFGSGGGVSASTGSGDRFVVFPDAVLVPDGYTSGQALSFSNTYDNASFASVGITPGVYVWAWGSGQDADSFTLNIVPEPASVTLLALGGLAFVARRQRRNI